jgi:hypothetical protein
MSAQYLMSIDGVIAGPWARNGGTSNTTNAMAKGEAQDALSATGDENFSA